MDITRFQNRSRSSRSFDSDDWCITDEISIVLQQSWGLCSIDMFAVHLAINAHILFLDGSNDSDGRLLCRSKPLVEKRFYMVVPPPYLIGGTVLYAKRNQSKGVLRFLVCVAASSFPA